MKQLKLIPILLPTEDATKVVKQFDTLYTINEIPRGASSFEERKLVYQHLYLVSAREIKIGDWCINKNGDTLYKVNAVEALTNWRRVEFSSDPELIADGVSALPETIDIPFGGKPLKINFLEEFCLQYNQKQSASVKGVDAEKLAGELHQWSDPHINGDITRDDCKLLVEWFKIKLQYNAGGFSLEGIKLLEDARYWLSTAVQIFNGSEGLNTDKKVDKYSKMVECGDKIQDYIQSLTPKQGEIEMYCEMEEKMLVKDERQHDAPMVKQIKLSKDGQPIIYFK